MLNKLSAGQKNDKKFTDCLQNTTTDLFFFYLLCLYVLSMSNKIAVVLLFFSSTFDLNKAVINAEAPERRVGFLLEIIHMPTNTGMSHSKKKSFSEQLNKNSHTGSKNVNQKYKYGKTDQMERN